MKLLSKVAMAVILTVPTTMLYAQSQDLINKAKQMGYSEEMIKKQINSNNSAASSLLQQGGATQGGASAKGSGLNSVSNTVDVEEQLSRSREKLEELLLEKERHRNIKDSVDRVVFGREIFSTKNLSFEPILNIATPESYTLAPGDEVIVDVWGGTQANYKSKVSPDGTVVFPNVGVVTVGGMPFSEAERKIKAALAKVFPLGDGSTSAKVTLGNIRSIQVNVAGEALVPGSYSLPSLATLFNAIYMAGGTNDIGTLRDIKVYRGGKEIASLDIYDYLLNGNTSSNIRLQDNDMIIIGPYHNLVKMSGKAKRNRIFEMKKGETLEDLLRYAGGFSSDAFQDNIQVNRKTGAGYQINTVNKDNFSAFQMHDGDSVRVQNSIPAFVNRVSVKGAVWRPDNYELSQGIHSVLSLIKNAGGIKGDAHTPRGQITRLRDDYTTEIIPLDIKGMLRGEVPDVELKAEDELYIPSIYELREKRYILVRGEVNTAASSKPVVVPSKITENIDDKSNILNIKPSVKGNIAKAAGLASTADNVIAIQDAITILENEKRGRGSENTKFIYETEVVPNVYRTGSDTLAFHENMTIEDAIVLAGGLKESASEAKVMVARRIKDPKSDKFTDKTAETFEFKINGDLSLNPEVARFQLQPFDEVYVRRSPGYQVQQTVNIKGETLFPGTYVLTSRNERLSSIIANAGGVTPESFVKGASLKRKKTEDDRRREETLLRIIQNTNETKDTMALLSMMADSMVVVAIDLEKALANPGSEYDIVLKDGDQIVVPSQVNTIKVNGGVLYPNTLTYHDKAKLKYYIEGSGGYALRARKKPYVIYMNGQVASTRGLFRRHPKLEPGAEIVVPMKGPRRKVSFGEIMGVASSLTSIAAMITAMQK